jgi:hypothetical protein
VDVCVERRRGYVVVVATVVVDVVVSGTGVGRGVNGGGVG